MRFRGERICRECGTEWSYFDARALECPDCGSFRSSSASSQRRAHTDGAPTFDTASLQDALDQHPVDAVIELRPGCRSYLQTAGFIDRGTLTRLSDEYLIVSELDAAGAELSIVRARRQADETLESYLLALMNGTLTGTRPEPGDVPSSARWIRGRGVVQGVREYVRDCRQWLRETDASRSEPTIGALGDHVSRIAALDGEVPASISDSVIDAARAVGIAVRTGDDSDREAARDALESIEWSP